MAIILSRIYSNFNKNVRLKLFADKQSIIYLAINKNCNFLSRIVNKVTTIFSFFNDYKKYFPPLSFISYHLITYFLI